MRETITPSYAQELLKNNTLNRTPKKQHIDNLAYQMANGQWLYNGETIVIAKDGRILDGQHRLMAIVKSNVTIESEIVREVEGNVMHTIDSGMARTGGDSLKLLGYERGVILAKISRSILQFRKKNVIAHTTDRKQLISNADIIAVIEKEHNIVDAIINSRAEHYYNKSGRLMTISEITLFWYIFKDIDEDKAFEFLNKLFIGINVSENDPVLLLRNILISNKMNHNKSISHSYKMKLIFKAWDRFFRNKTLKKLNIRSEEKLIFPKEYPYYEIND